MQLVSYIPCTLAFAHPVSHWPRRKSPLLFNSPSLLLTSEFLLNFPCRFLFSIYHTDSCAVPCAVRNVLAHAVVRIRIAVSSNTLSSFECFMSIGAGFRFRNSVIDYSLCAGRSCSLCHGNVRLGCIKCPS